MVKKAIEWYCESAALVYRPDHYNDHREIW